MRYKPEWKGRLKIGFTGTVEWDGKRIGKVAAVHRPGAKSPGGMVTDTVYQADGTEYPSMTQAAEALIAKAQNA
jgi:hypothetical protein